MKVKTSIALEKSTLVALDEIAGAGSSRSRVVEQAVVELIDRRRQQLRDTRDREILDAASESLNEEMQDVLGFQVEL